MDRSPTLPLSALIAITVIIGGFFWIRGPLESRRPAPADLGERPSFGQQDVEARLWQDPFAAVHAHRNQAGEHDDQASAVRHRSGALRQVIARQDSILIMPVMVPGGDYAVDVEQRRRTRKAVMAALGVEGYIPADGSHVGYLETRWVFETVGDDGPRLMPDGALVGPLKPMDVIFPLEWFSWQKNETAALTRRPGTAEKILVLWLDESMMGRHTVSMLDQVLEQLGFAGSPRSTRVQIIGPSSSTTVLGMMEKGAALRSRTPGPRRSLLPTTFYSCRSTASEQLLLAEVDSACIGSAFAASFEDLVGAGFVRSVATDSALIAILFDELATRGVKLENADTHIALVGEWDTFYGRAIPHTIADQLARLESDHDRPSPAQPRLHRFHYLRGLDGILPGTDNPSRKSGGSSSGGSATATTAFVSRPDDAAWPFGRNQLDNIQRLTGRMERLDHQLELENKGWRQPFKHGIDIIGVVGSDIYDKLLILQALTRRFPNAIFFTTDLDAQMLHPTQQAWARNVIVVSGYGLALRDELQRFTLPFRDSYQTATYVAVQQALADLPPVLNLEPRVFEIGRHGLVDLSTPRISELHPPVPEMGLRFRSPWPRFGRLIVALATIAAIVLALLFQRSVRRIAASENPEHQEYPLVTPAIFAGTAGVLLVSFGALYLVSTSLWNAGGNEPVAAFGGVSAWPIQYWRVAVLVLSGAFFFYAGRTLKAHVRRVELRFGLGEEARREVATGGNPDLANTLKHWTKYKNDGRRNRRARRVALGMAVFAAFMFGLYLIYGLPPAPFRGRTVVWLHWSLLGLSGLAAASVTVFVLDAILLCWRRILTLAPVESGWPPRLVRAFRSRLEVPERITEPINQVLDLEIIGDTTRVVGNLLRWPFLLLFMMILSRNTLHESWNLTPTLLYTYGALFTLALISAIGLRTQAARARNHVLNNLRAWRCGIDPDPEMMAMQAHGGDVAAGGGDSQSTAVDCSWIDRVTDHVMAMDKGAFAPWYRHPIIQSVLLPASGLMLITVTELIARSGQ